jgi:excinuclease ABC subunit A
MKKDKLIIQGAREHNLKNIDVEIFRDKLTVITGVSGSGKSSLAFDTIFAEGQRRYVESLSPYARQFLGVMEKPDVDLIDGLSPAISIQQKSGIWNPRSTVGTTTEIYDYLRLLFARVGIPHCPQCNRVISKQTVQQMTDHILTFPEKGQLVILAPIVSSRKGEYRKIFDQIQKDGFVKVRVDGKILSLDEKIVLDRNKKHDIEIVVDRLILNSEIRKRLVDSLETALKHGKGVLKILLKQEHKESEHLFSENYACAICGISLEQLEPRNFSFNNPHGACPACMGMGFKMEVDEALIVSPQRSIRGGAIIPFASVKSRYYQDILYSVCEHFNASIDAAFENLSSKVKNAILYGSEEKIEFDFTKSRFQQKYYKEFEGVIPNLERRYHETDSDYLKEEFEQYMVNKACRVCHGTRLKPESLAVKIGDKNIIEITQFSILECIVFLNQLKLEGKFQMVADQILREIQNRLNFLKNVGLDYLTLDRMTSTLSGGESQRIHLATQIGSALVGVLYILDEPSIGLHQRDNGKLLKTLKQLRDIGNTVIVVEHDEETMEQSDFIIDMGIGAGIYGGTVVAAGTFQDILNNPQSLTGQYLSGKIQLEANMNPRSNSDKKLILKNAHKNNLKKIDVEFPLGTFICVTGVSGSGKSTLIMETLYPAVQYAIYGLRSKPEGFDSLIGTENIDKVIEIDQSPIGRTPRSNTATYTGLFTEIRDLFSNLPESRARGYKEGRFSFNVKGGRCEACSGDGVLKIEMHFLPDVYVACEACKGKRYNRETLEIQYKSKTIADILDLSVDEASEFFLAIPRIKRMLLTLKDVGLGYIKLGQSAVTLSGGEAQRIKLSTELGRRSTGKTLYILDEPTTGLHFADVHRLVLVLKRLVEAGNTVIVIEHNLDVIKMADYIVDLGPEGGTHGGEVIARGDIQAIIKNSRSYTGQFLKVKLQKDKKLVN